MDFDIGVLAFSYDPTGEFMQNITVIDRDGLNHRQTHVVDRKYLIHALETGLMVKLAREWPGMHLNDGLKGPEYASLRRITSITVNGIHYLKATLDTSACDDMG